MRLRHTFSLFFACRCGSTGVGYSRGRHYKVLLAERCWWHAMVLHELGTEYLTLYVNLSESSGVTNG